MPACTQTDCGGTIAPDGYCDTCGFSGATAGTPPSVGAPTAPGTVGPAPAAPATPGTVGPAAAVPAPSTVGPAPGTAVPAPSTVGPAPGTAVPAGSACTQSGCGGTIAADGYCDTCGLVAKAGRTPGSPGGSAASLSAPSIAAPAAPEASSRIASSGGRASTRQAGSRRSATSRTRLGVGLVDVAPTTIGDPALALMSPEKIESVLGVVAEADRHCTSCGRPVGRSADGTSGRITGFCGSCRTPFDFVTNAPVLAAGDLIGGQYEILGPLAHGGMGWIYLGRDRAVSGRWVVLKGLLNEDDPDAIASAVAERQFLAQIEHGNIVNIYNFVTSGGAGYIVMEFVGGQSLNSKLKDRRKVNNGVPDPLPVAEAIAYILGILPALAYLHGLGLVYNDLKPANIMATGDDVKLIDVGGVMHIDDAEAAIFGTQGFQAPEVASAGPSVASDLFTVGRTLAVMILDFRFHSGEYLHALPSQRDEPLFVQWESLYRFLLKATAPHPDDRFQTANEMSSQLTGVLREIVAVQNRIPRPTPSVFFGGDRLTDLLIDEDDETSAVNPEWRALPIPKVDSTDAAAAFLLDLPEGDSNRAVHLLNEALIAKQIEPTVEVLLVFARVLIESGDAEEASRAVDRVSQLDPWEWRTTWFRGVIALQAGESTQAADSFSEVWTELPGEVAPKLAVALAAEMAGAHDRAVHLYQSVVATDPTFVSASFGLARCRAALGDRNGAVEAYRSVPVSSATYTEAQVASARALALDSSGGALPTAEELSAAAATVERLQLDNAERARLSAQILEQAFHGFASGTLQTTGDVTLFGRKLTERNLRLGLESTYRELARVAPTSDERVELVERANRIRPVTLF